MTPMVRIQRPGPCRSTLVARIEHGRNHPPFHLHDEEFRFCKWPCERGKVVFPWERLSSKGFEKIDIKTRKKMTLPSLDGRGCRQYG